MRIAATPTTALSYDEDWFAEPRAIALATMDKKRLVLDERAWTKCLDVDDIRHLPVSVVCVSGASEVDNAIVMHFLVQCLTNLPDNDATLQQQQDGWSKPWLVDKHIRFLADHYDADVTKNSVLPIEKKPAIICPIRLVAWSRPIVMRRRCAVLVVACNAEWDTKQWSSGKAKMFAFSALLSNCLIVDVKQGMGLSQRVMQVLDFFAAYERSVRHVLSARSRIFQQLTILVSNLQEDRMQNGDNAALPLGVHDGRALKDVCAGLKPLEPVAVCFDHDKFKCCLAPSHGDLPPPPNLSSSSTIDVALLPKSFVRVMASLAELVTRGVAPKSLNGYVLTCTDLLEFGAKYATILQDDGAAPDVPRLVTTTVDNCLVKICDDKLEKYKAQHNYQRQQRKPDVNLLRTLLDQFDAETAGGDLVKLHRRRAELEQNLWSSRANGDVSVMSDDFGDDDDEDMNDDIEDDEMEYDYDAPSSRNSQGTAPVSVKTAEERTHADDIDSLDPNVVRRTTDAARYPNSVLIGLAAIFMGLYLAFKTNLSFNVTTVVALVTVVPLLAVVLCVRQQKAAPQQHA